MRPSRPATRSRSSTSPPPSRAGSRASARSTRRNRIGIQDAIDAYTINGAQYLDMDKETGSLETGKSADLIVLDQDILALADGGKADDIAKTKVLETWFMGREVYRR